MFFKNDKHTVRLLDSLGKYVILSVSKHFELGRLSSLIDGKNYCTYIAYIPLCILA